MIVDVKTPNPRIDLPGQMSELRLLSSGSRTGSSPRILLIVSTENGWIVRHGYIDLLRLGFHFREGTHEHHLTFEPLFKVIKR